LCNILSWNQDGGNLEAGMSGLQEFVRLNIGLLIYITQGETTSMDPLKERRYKALS